MAPSRLALNALRTALRFESSFTTLPTKNCARSVRQCSKLSCQPTRSSRHPSPLHSRQTQFLSPMWAHSRGLRTAEKAKSKYRTGPASPLAVLLFIGSGIGMYYYIGYEKERMERQRVAEHSKGMGKPKVGGSFTLVDQHGQPWSSEQMKGKYALIYFGFSHCPDICPEELDKMSEMISLVEDAVPSSSARNPELLPIFITCDPARDTPEVLKVYLKEFDDRFVGLTGAWEQIKEVCKAYRVYFSTPPGVKPGMDYLVDHSIYFYLMDPDGDFVEAIGRQHTAEAGAEVISMHMKDWKGQIVKG